MAALPGHCQPNALLLGRYRVQHVLGKGGFGVVVRAWDERLSRQVAIKIPCAGAAVQERAEARFLREAKVCARLKSEFTNRLYDAGVDQTLGPYLIMEFLQGRDLADEVSVGHRMPVLRALHVTLQASVALAEAHSAGVIHRDVKPANLFLAEHVGEERLKVLDFGIAGLADTDEALTSSSTIMGTPRYMAPEHVLGSALVDKRADVWALGVVLYELLCGAPVRDGRMDFTFLIELARSGPIPIRQRWPEVPSQLEQVLTRSLATDPDARTGTMGQFALALAPMVPPEMRVLAERAARLDP